MYLLFIKINLLLKCFSLLWGSILPTQGSNPGLPHCRWILYQFNHKGRPRILEWIAYPFTSGFPDSGIEMESPAFQEDSLPTELSRKPQVLGSQSLTNKMHILMKFIEIHTIKRGNQVLHQVLGSQSLQIKCIPQ